MPEPACPPSHTLIPHCHLSLTFLTPLHTPFPAEHWKAPLTVLSCLCAVAHLVPFAWNVLPPNTFHSLPEAQAECGLPSEAFSDPPVACTSLGTLVTHWEAFHLLLK